jgi:hypothetical protein
MAVSLSQKAQQIITVQANNELTLTDPRDTDLMVSTLARLFLPLKMGTSLFMALRTPSPAAAPYVRSKFSRFHKPYDVGPMIFAVPR